MKISKMKLLIQTMERTFIKKATVFFLKINKSKNVEFRLKKIVIRASLFLLLQNMRISNKLNKQKVK